MDKFYNDRLHKLETVINDFEIEADCSIQRIETVIHHILKCLSEMKGSVLKRGFKKTDEEIRFQLFQFLCLYRLLLPCLQLFYLLLMQLRAL